ncbi:hypothetical protein LRAMOSA07225 [Lichtheimia ramosa]|uniref:Acyl-coenzyme A oxidase n=1 Tax=Lichtheimia ramosa TaxID=688394 RepID=A0A077WB89_9FUNG|nr:hypothetical protein LRAMOSA07225 [Lichtheimia ramosa]
MSNSNQLQQSVIDLNTARQKATFPVDLLTTFIRGGPEALAKRQQIRQLLENEPAFDSSRAAFQSRQEQLADSIVAARRMIEIAEERNMSFEEYLQMIAISEYPTPLTLNYGAFIPVIQSQGTDEQIAKWLTASKRHAILGCYAQTELSHGSNVVGLQTTATFDEATDEFIINSPDITAAKWWIGGLGVAATHAVLQAQLILKGKNYGPHIFIVPIRSPVDHKPVKGVTVGDIGPKAYGGFSVTDNGFAFFDHVRIPRDNMLMRFAKVSRSGEYTPPVHSKLSYGSMVKLRVGIVSDAGWRLARACTIAIRYCTMRRQFNATAADKMETQVIEYSSVKHRLFPLVASAYALILGGMKLAEDFNIMTEQLSRQDAHMLPEMHITSCALKVWGARRGSEGIEEARKTMGGHGFSVFSGVSEQFANFVPANTYEGENFVLCQQVGRALLKQIKNLASGKDVSLKTVDYLNLLKQGDLTQPVTLTGASSLHDSKTQLAILGTRAARLAANLAKKVQSGRAWPDLNLECWEICLAHAEYHLLQQLVNKIQQLQSSTQYSALVPVIQSIADLFFLSISANTALATLVTTQSITPATADLIQDEYHHALNNIANNAVGLTDAFGFTDKELNTALGKKEGNPYGALWDIVQTNPVNSEQGKQHFGDLIKTIIHRKDNLSYINAAKL